MSLQYYTDGNSRDKETNDDNYLLENLQNYDNNDLLKDPMILVFLAFFVFLCYKYAPIRPYVFFKKTVLWKSSLCSMQKIWLCADCTNQFFSSKTNEFWLTAFYPYVLSMFSMPILCNEVVLEGRYNWEKVLPVLLRQEASFSQDGGNLLVKYKSTVHIHTWQYGNIWLLTLFFRYIYQNCINTICGRGGLNVFFIHANIQAFILFPYPM